MATVQLNRPELLEAIRQLAPDEFDAFLESALSLRNRPHTGRLSAQESRLIQRINLGIPEKISDRYDELTRKRKRRTLAEDEQTELLQLTDQIERRDAERAADLLELARARRVPIRTLMKQMGIGAAPVNG